MYRIKYDTPTCRPHVEIPAFAFLTFNRMELPVLNALTMSVTTIKAQGFRGGILETSDLIKLCFINRSVDTGRY